MLSGKAAFQRANLKIGYYYQNKFKIKRDTISGSNEIVDFKIIK